MLTSKNIILGVTGGIAAYKAAELASMLTQAGAMVDVIMTEAATRFITPLTFQTLTRRPVIIEMFRLLEETKIAHVSLAERADLIAIVPATANTIAKIACGLADDMLSATILATQAPVVIAPAMNDGMYSNPITQENLARLRARGMTIVEPVYGRLASGRIGKGRLAKPHAIFGTIRQVLGQHGQLAGKRAVITAGGTQEPIDPVRFISNRSSGKMGYALAEALRDRGAKVTLISAPTALPVPVGVELVQVTTALEMKSAVEEALSAADILIMAAAVADYRPERSAPQKMKRVGHEITLKLVENPDILAGAADKPVFKVGFAAESENLIANAREKLIRKRLNLVVANDISSGEGGFGSDFNKVTLVEPGDGLTELPLLPKSEVAEKIVDKIVAMIGLA
ncbi:MAG: bifunctional phosphopantothenoylcysteine decarboxylase/phosphopantothenate--cysteine ligase CoaBC [Chloroflexi bacterium]|nr:bifunctional phosphopantothenoylcysteine decarboxylase/phosphopantothenate--cysteine ligase CoaBC [Chloroflexota bacterium]MCL5075550.1 bifunctional phosphopantothenoylcysteine decarboxylase/phosphopantothenate--cysteine ligase CoaBC [Chloroflexota bacterium]